MEEKELYERKAVLLQRALSGAEALDTEDAKKAIMRPVYELEPGRELAAGEYDGTEDLLGDDTLETDWDISDGGVPPPGFWAGTHTRHGERILGFTEEEYLDGDTWR